MKKIIGLAILSSAFCIETYAVCNQGGGYTNCPNRWNTTSEANLEKNDQSLKGLQELLAKGQNAIVCESDFVEVKLNRILVQIDKIEVTAVNSNGTCAAVKNK